MPAYFRYFDSLAMPSRLEVPYQTVDSDSRYARGPLYNLYKDVIDFVVASPNRIRQRWHH